MKINKIIGTTLLGAFCLFCSGLQAETTKVIRVFNGNKVVGEFVASNVDCVEIADPEPLQEINGHEYVDLGLPSGLKWATCNVGASARNEYGTLFCWGDPEPKTGFIVSSSVNGVELGDIAGDPKYDAVTAAWGGTWRLPTLEDAKELLANCKIVFRNENGVPGNLVTGPNGNQIFLPFNKYEDGNSALWLSTPAATTDRAYYLYTIVGSYYTNFTSRNSKYAVRGVSE